MEEATCANGTAETNEKTETPLFRYDGKYELVSKVAYLLGVPMRHFDGEHVALDIEIYHQLEKIRAARIIRNLCLVRTLIEQNFKKINLVIQKGYGGLHSVPDIIPPEVLRQLTQDGANFIKKSSTRLFEHIIEINRLILDRINNCQELIPSWVNWSYIKDLFIMPDGLTPQGVRDAATLYYANRNLYPYQIYMNWQPMEAGNVFYNDKKFASLLYQWHGETFNDFSKVADAGSYVKKNIYEFVGDSEKTVVVVDCENSDPYKLCAMLRSLDHEALNKITKIILFDDEHAATGWRILESFVHVPIEHIMIERIKQNKSLVDIRLAAGVCKEHYQNNVDSFVIVSSDSDYWGLISSLPDVRFIVVIEMDKCGPDMKNALVEAGIFYCYLDDFYSGNVEEIKTVSIFKAIYGLLEAVPKINMSNIFNEALNETRIEMSSAEKAQFYEKYIKHMNIKLDEAGNVSFELKRN